MRGEGLDSALAALRFWRVRHEMLAHNLANVSTHGFKGERAFARLIDGALPGVASETDLRTGTLTPTDSTLDIALDGDGFLVVDTPDGERLTRGGAFQIDELGRLTDGRGNALLGEGGPLFLPPGSIRIDTDGTLLVEGARIDRLRVERPVPEGEIGREDGVRFSYEGRLEPVERGRVRVLQGFLEESNVNAVESMVELVTVQRAYAAVSRAVEALDGVAATVANDLARPQ